LAPQSMLGCTHWHLSSCSIVLTCVYGLWSHTLPPRCIENLGRVSGYIVETDNSCMLMLWPSQFN